MIYLSWKFAYVDLLLGSILALSLLRLAMSFALDGQSCTVDLQIPSTDITLLFSYYILVFFVELSLFLSANRLVTLSPSQRAGSPS